MKIFTRVADKFFTINDHNVCSSCHKPRDSLFSWSSGFNNFTGLVNWGFLLLTMGGFRLLLENFIKYGIRIDPIQWFYVLTGKNEGQGFPSVILTACKWGMDASQIVSTYIYSHRER